MKKVLVTGADGFIGSHLTDALLANGHSVRILDDLSTGKRGNLPLDNPALELIEGDVANAALVARAMAGCSAVAHLAASDAVFSITDDSRVWFLNGAAEDLFGDAEIGEPTVQALFTSEALRRFGDPQLVEGQLVLWTAAASLSAAARSVACSWDGSRW